MVGHKAEAHRTAEGKRERYDQLLAAAASRLLTRKLHGAWPQVVRRLYVVASGANDALQPN